MINHSTNTFYLLQGNWLQLQNGSPKMVCHTSIIGLYSHEDKICKVQSDCINVASDARISLIDGR
jgi:hypothetical protein